MSLFLGLLGSFSVWSINRSISVIFSSPFSWVKLPVVNSFSILKIKTLILTNYITLAFKQTNGSYKISFEISSPRTFSINSLVSSIFTSARFFNMSSAKFSPWNNWNLRIKFNFYEIFEKLIKAIVLIFFGDYRFRRPRGFRIWNSVQSVLYWIEN